MKETWWLVVTFFVEESSKMKMLAGLTAIMDIVALLGAISGNYLARLNWTKSNLLDTDKKFRQLDKPVRKRRD